MLKKELIAKAQSGIRRLKSAIDRDISLTERGAQEAVELDEK